MLENLKKLNKDIKVYSVFDKEFATYGRVVKGIDVEELIKVAESIEMPENGTLYKPSEEKFEALSIAKTIENDLFGGVPAQMGYCWGYNSIMDATEWHTGSEINIAVTDLVLILGHVWDIEDNKIDSSKFEAFFMPKGTVIECYATSLHYCPCQTDDSGFKSFVGLPKDTNTDITHDNNNPLLFAKNKWLIAHSEAKSLLKDGALEGITGTNYIIKY